MNFNSIWKSYLNEEKELALLAEARVKDIKKKYPILDKAGWIKYGRSQIEGILGPKGTSKYLMWFARELSQNFKDDIEDNPEWTGTGDDEVDDVTEVANALLEAIMAFQENQQRMEEKDIYKFHAGELQMALSKLGLSSSQLRDKEKAAAMETTEIVYDENGIFAVRPLDKVSSCYFGKNTRWCISATQSQNYFDQYTSDEKAFVMVRFDGIPASHSMHKLALVYDREGNLEEVFDAPDNDHSDIIVYQAAALHFGEEDYELIDDEDKKEKIDDIASDIIQYGYMNVLDNPPDPTATWEAKAQEIEDSYKDKIEHAHYGFEIDDYGEGSYLTFHGSLSIELDNEIFEGGKYNMPSGWQAESILTRELVDKMSESQIYFEEIEILDNGGVTEFYLRFSTENYEYNPGGYDNFLDNIQYTERNYKAIRRIILKYLADEEYIKPGVFDTFRTTLDDVRQSLSNFVVSDLTDYVGEEEIRFENKSGIPTSIPDRDFLRFIADEKMGGRYKNPELTKIVISKLQDLNQAIQTYLAQQLELPINDLPPRVVQDLSIPNSLEVSIYGGTGSSTIDAYVRVSLDNPEADQEELELGLNIVKFIDQNYDKVSQAVVEAVDELVQLQVSAQRKVEESFPEEAKQFIAFAKKSNNRDVQDLLARIPNYTRATYSISKGWAGGRSRAENVSIGEYVYNMVRSNVLRNVHRYLQEPDPKTGEVMVIPGDTRHAFEVYAPPWDMEGLTALTRESVGVQSEIDGYFNRIDEEKGRTRASGIYKFYCMIGYTADESGESSRGLDDILADFRALEGVTIVTVVVANRKIADHRYISGLSVKFIPSTPGQIRSPEDTKARILRDVRRLRNVERIFKVSTSVERIE